MSISIRHGGRVARRIVTLFVCGAFAGVLLAGCGDDDSGSGPGASTPVPPSVPGSPTEPPTQPPTEPPAEPPEPSTYAIGGTVSGLAGGGRLVLLNNGADTLEVTSDGAFRFATPVAANGSYAVTVATQPTGQVCSVTGGVGAGVTAPVTGIAVACSASRFSIGGAVRGLASGQQVTLRNNGADAITVNANGGFVFPTQVAYNGSYAVTVSAQPPGQICTVNGFSGSAVAADVSNIDVVCATLQYTVGGTLSGLDAGAQITLANNGGDFLTVNADGAFTFATPVAYGGSYAVTVSTQPAGQTCTVAAGSGGGVTANVNGVTVQCQSWIGQLYSSSSVTYSVELFGILSNGQLAYAGTARTGASMAASLAFQPSPRRLYLGVSNESAIEQYAIANSGALNALTPPRVSTGGGALRLVRHPSGQYLYTADSSGSSIGIFSILPDGTLSFVGNQPLPIQPFTVAITPNGQNLYVASTADNAIHSYTIGTGGTLTPLASTPAGLSMWDIAIDPTGSYLYASDQNGNAVLQYTIGGGGTLTPMATAAVSTGGSAREIRIHPTLPAVYVISSSNSTIAQFTIGPGGQLASAGAVPTGANPVTPTIDASGEFFYVPEILGKRIWQYHVNATTGLLTPLSPSTVTTPAQPSVLFAVPR